MKKSEKYIIVGIILILLSIIQLFFPRQMINLTTSLFYLGFFYFGIILICDGITQKIYDKSQLHEILKNRRNLIVFSLVSLLGAIGAEGIMQWLGKLWIYPFWSQLSYIFIFIPCWIIYWLMIIESYLATKAIFDYFKKGKQIVTKSYNFELIFYKILGFAGLILFSLAIFLMIRDYYLYQGKYVFEVIQNVTYKVNFGYVVMVFLGAWFILEAIEYYRKETSLIKDMIHGNFTPLWSIIIGSLVLAILMELTNEPLGYWIYTHWPWENYKLFGLPVSIYLAWPMQYVTFLSLYRAITTDQSDEIWKGEILKTEVLLEDKK